jgi:hypothetical protein
MSFETETVIATPGRHRDSWLWLLALHFVWPALFSIAQMLWSIEGDVRDRVVGTTPTAMIFLALYASGALPAVMPCRGALTWARLLMWLVAAVLGGVLANWNRIDWFWLRDLGMIWPLIVMPQLGWLAFLAAAPSSAPTGSAAIRPHLRVLRRVAAEARSINRLVGGPLPRWLFICGGLLAIAPLCQPGVLSWLHDILYWRRFMSAADVWNILHPASKAIGPLVLVAAGLLALFGWSVQRRRWLIAALLWLAPVASYAGQLIAGEHRLRDVLLGRADNLLWIDLALAWSAYLLTLPAGRGVDAINKTGIAHDSH